MIALKVISDDGTVTYETPMTEADAASLLRVSPRRLATMAGLWGVPVYRVPCQLMSRLGGRRALYRRCDVEALRKSLRRTLVDGAAA